MADTDNAARTPRPPATTGKAIILAAGVGSRLRPFTDEAPKCLVPVGGVPILINALRSLAAAGIRETVIVVGHLKEMIFERVGDSLDGMKVTYVVSQDYARTNNIYSLWLAREHLTESVLLLECDVFMERRLIERMLSGDGDNLAAVSRHQPGMSGTVARIDADGHISALVDSRHQGPRFDFSDTYKTVNVYRLGGDFLRDYFVPRLEARIAAGDVHDFYETVLRALCHPDGETLTAVLCDDVRWIEIDNEDDLATANYLFATPEQRYDIISAQYGSYWHYDFTDHAFLYNLYFPPQAVFDHFTEHVRDLVLNYPAGQGALAHLMGTLIGEPPERIVVANGASELIKIIGSRLRRRLIVPVPSFNEWVNAVPREMVTESALQPPTFQLDVDRFAREAVESGAGIAVVLNPNNPTSLAVPGDDLVRLVRVLARHDIMVIVDESFVDFMDDGRRASLQGEIGRHHNLAIMKSLSKCYGIGGLRLGYLLTANAEFAEAVRAEMPIWNINGLAEAFLGLAPRYRDEFARSCQSAREDRDDLYWRLCAVPGLRVYRPEANFVLCRLPEGAMSGPKLTRQLFITHNILVKDCAGKTMPEADRYLRIASRTQDDNRRLAEAMRSVLRREPTWVSAARTAD